MATSPAASLSNGNDADAPTQEFKSLAAYESANGSAPGSGRSAGRLTLTKPLSKTTWLGRLGPTVVAARPLPRGTEGLDSVSITDRVERLHSGHLCPFIGVETLDGTRWAVSQYMSGAPLDRLMTAAILTPFQATTVAMEIFGGLAALHGAGLAHGRLTSGAVRIGTDGMVRLTDWAFTALASPPAVNVHAAIDGELDAEQFHDLSMATAIASELGRNADRPNSRRGRDDGELLSCLAKFGAIEPVNADDAYDHLRRVLRSAARTMPERANVHVELAALVAATTKPSSALAAGLARSAAGTARRLPPIAQRRKKLSGAKWHLPKRRRITIAVLGSAAVVVALAAFAVAGPGRSVIHRVLHRHTAASPAPPSAAPKITIAAGGKPRPVPRSARSAGSINAVVTSVPHGCAPGRTCAVRVRVRLTPSTTPRRIKLAVSVFDRCQGTTIIRRARPLVAPRGATSVHGVRRVAVPVGKAIGLTVITTRPARAAAAPVLLPASKATC